VFVGRVHPELRELVADAASALAQLDAKRLEELALTCRELCDRSTHGEAETAGIYRQAQEASRKVTLLGRVLDATRANVRVVKQLRDSRGQQSGYEERQ